MSFIANWFDIVFIATIFITAILAFLRGFIRDLAGFFNWVIATFLTYLLTPFIVALFAKGHYADVINKLTVSSVLFILILILSSLITSKITRDMSERVPASVDQSLGFAFGFAKAYIICALIFAIIVVTSTTKNKSNGRVGPDWLTASKSYKIIEVGGVALKPAAKAILKTFNGAKLIEEERVKEKVLKKIEESEKAKKVGKKVAKTVAKEAIKDAKGNKKSDSKSAKTTGKGYDVKERQKMNRLIESIE